MFRPAKTYRSFLRVKPAETNGTFLRGRIKRTVRFIRLKPERRNVDLSQSMIVIHFDGSCDPNPGGICRYGFVVWRDDRKIHEGHGLAAPCGAGATNNVAEYTGCLRALEWLADQRVEEPAVVRGDSELVIKQLKGLYKVRSPLLAPLYWKVRELFAGLPAVRLEWVPRERNVDADRLAGLR
jgi:ribonuclease HI